MISLTILLVAFSESIIHPEKLPMENPDLLGGDIIGLEEDMRNAVISDEARWPNAIVPYVIDDLLAKSNETVKLIKTAMKDFHSQTCIRFKERNNETDYIKLIYGEGCFSMVGRVGGEQVVSLGSGCLILGTIIHELNHAIGFYHEQNRPDRDEYLVIYWENIKQDMKSQFRKYNYDQMKIFDRFDYNSIMLYGERYFSKNFYDKTMKAKQKGRRLLDIGEKSGLSMNDIFRITMLYKCGYPDI